MKKQSSKLKRGYGWRPDVPDPRDLYKYLPDRVKKLCMFPARVDLREHYRTVPVLDQSQLASCTGQAITKAFMCAKGNKDFRPSPLFIYYNERRMEGNVPYDSGAMIRTGIKSINRYGAAPEVCWPYVIKNFRTRPPASCYSEALKHQSLQYRRVPQVILDFKYWLSQNLPIVFGFAVHQSFESIKVARTGIYTPDINKEVVLGGHAVVLYGYDDATERFLVANSWGERWGQKGFFTMPYSLVLNNDVCTDFWCIEVVEN